MGKGERIVVETCLAALYLPGTPHRQRLHRRHWCRVRDALCLASPRLGGAPDTLREAGLWDEAAALAQPDALDWAAAVLEAERAWTAVSDSYPSRWLRVLGHSAPPCVWATGPMSWHAPVGVVGCRQLSPADSQLACALGTGIVRRGGALVTGGAAGADSMAVCGALGAGGEERVVVVLPCGLGRAPVPSGVVAVSASPPGAPFSAGQAHERNALIYAAAPWTLVVRARYREGGTWHGAAAALRRGLCGLGVQHDDSDPASVVLRRLGARPYVGAEDALCLVGSGESERRPTLWAQGESA